jgi:hypothetical protein
LTEKGFFDLLVTLFKYISYVAAEQEEKGEEDISTEELWTMMTVVRKYGYENFLFE